jgi:hypothetical protein
MAGGDGWQGYTADSKRLDRATAEAGTASIDGRRCMPIRPYLKGVDVAVFDLDTIQAMCDAFEAACRALPAVLDRDHARRMLAKRIIALAACGERDPARLRIAAMEEVGLVDVAAPAATDPDALTQSYAPQDHGPLQVNRINV